MLGRAVLLVPHGQGLPVHMHFPDDRGPCQVTQPGRGRALIGQRQPQKPGQFVAGGDEG